MFTTPGFHRWIRIGPVTRCDYAHRKVVAMIAYEVVLECDPAITGRLEDHMRREHIPEIFTTGCFQRIVFEHASGPRFRTRYEASTMVDLERYLQEHAPRLRVAFQAHFPTGVTIGRETWDVLERWD
jgi:hypothetical protein